MSPHSGALLAGWGWAAKWLEAWFFIFIQRSTTTLDRLWAGSMDEQFCKYPISRGLEFGAAGLAVSRVGQVR